MQKILYASDYARLDSNVQTGGGTDDTEILQSLLDKAASWGSLKLIMDGAALVRGLKVHSNTTIECLNKDCGFFLADHADCAVLANDVFSYGERKTRNVTLIGGTYNHNCLHQAHHIRTDDPTMTADTPDNDGCLHYTVAMEFIGIENLNVRDVTVRDQRTFAFTVGNFSHVNIENTYIDLVHEIDFGNQDGFHFWGPGQFLTMRNVGGKTEDDFMNIGPDERDSVSSITDVLIDGVFLDHAWQGIRLLSKNAGTLDRVTIRNVTGTYRLYGFYLNPWFIQPTNGHFGNITFENIDLRPENQEEESDYTRIHPRFLFSIGGLELSVFVPLGLILLVVSYIVLYKTRFGLRLRACGEHPQAADSVGINVYKMRYAGVILSGALGAVGGLAYIVPPVQTWNFEVGVAGAGFLAMAVMIFGQWKPFNIFGAAMFFAVFKSLANIADSTFLAQLHWSSNIYNMMPFVASMVILAFTSKNSMAPKAEGIPYDKGSR